MLVAEKKRKEKLRRQQNTPCIIKEKETHWPEVHQRKKEN
jgi:hypothetical protein